MKHKMGAPSGAPKCENSYFLLFRYAENIEMEHRLCDYSSNMKNL